MGYQLDAEADPLVTPDSFQDTKCAGEPVNKYTIGEGRRYLQKRRVEHDEPLKWAELVPGWNQEADNVWPALAQLRKTLQPKHWILWWRILRHNVMTGVRVAHMHPESSPECPHCIEGRIGQTQHTVQHMFIGCQLAANLWKDINAWLHQGIPGMLSPYSASNILCPWSTAVPQVAKMVGTVHSIGLWTIWVAHWQWIFEERGVRASALRQEFQRLLEEAIQIKWRRANWSQKGPEFEAAWRIGGGGLRVVKGRVTMVGWTRVEVPDAIIVEGIG